jgi:pilus assembly protein CpaB
MLGGKQFAIPQGTIMKPARIIILTVAVVAAGMAGLLVVNMVGRPPVIVQQAESLVQKEPTVDVLVTKENMPVGSRLNADNVEWMPWPQGSVAEGLITKAKSPDAVTALAGSVVRLPLFTGEPIRPEKIADSNSRILSSLLPAGKRAIATDITVSTGAGGFILPNDRVDVIMVRRDDNRNFQTRTILSNVRVLAIDQQIQEQEDGSKAVVGSTATLELTPDQAKVIAVAQQMADRLTLALRSVADAGEEDTSIPKGILNSGTGADSITVIKSGELATSSTTAAQSQ